MSKTVRSNQDIIAKKTQAKAVLKEANLYQNSNSLQRRDASEVLKEYSSRIQWKKEKKAKILDIGCGDGGVTAHVLKPYLPENFEKLVGCDISADMIRHANLHHKNEKVEFKVADISSDVGVVGQFDHIFSFYALHWVQEQEKCLRNIYSMLLPGGDCLLAFLGHIPIYDIYRTLASRSTWAEYMYDLDKYISPYHDSERPDDEFQSLMAKCGFRDVDVQCKSKVYIYEGIDVLKKALRAVNPFNHRLSPALREQFLEEYLELVRQQDLISDPTNTGGDRATIKACYTLLVAYAVK